MPSNGDKPRRCLILDFDGVLVDTEPLHFKAWQHAFEQLMDIRIAGNHHLLVGLSLDQIYHLWASSKSGAFDMLTPDLRQQLLALKTQHFLALAADQLEPMPGSIALLRCAQTAGWYTAIVSRSLRMRLHRTLDLIHMPALFDLILGSEDAVDPLTDRKNHARAAHIFNIDPQACIVVEDSVSGVEDALVSGIGTVIGFTSSLESHALQQAGAHAVIAHLDELLLDNLLHSETSIS